MAKREKTKDLKFYMSLEYPMTVTEDREDGGHVVEFSDLPGCVGYGETPNAVFKDAKAAKKMWIETALELGRKVPEPKPEEEYSGRFTQRLPKDLHKRLTEQAKVEGRSLNQHIAILLSNRSNALELDKLLTKMDEKIKLLGGGLGVTEYTKTLNYEGQDVPEDVPLIVEGLSTNADTKTLMN
ncbi:MAG: toxin-antitoxin system HicB family antitoxin [Deltaproteobacteria bacterium]|nr:toxin-antitoxin system HicB family antitoxin [Deltaproteobacteria bacterium]